MEKPQLGILLLLFSFFVHGQDVIFKTVSFLNAQYLTSETWGEDFLPANESRDVNHPLFGGKYYPPFSVQLQSHDPRVTIARGFLLIEADIINRSNKTLVLEQVDLLIKNQYPIPDAAERLDWEVGSRGSGYNPYFIIDGKQSIYSHLPNEFILSPAGDPQDSRISLEIESYGHKTIWHFEFELIFFDPSVPDKKIKIHSDKQYFIASE